MRSACNDFGAQPIFTEGRPARRKKVFGAGTTARHHLGEVALASSDSRLTGNLMKSPRRRLRASTIDLICAGLFAGLTIGLMLIVIN